MPKISDIANIVEQKVDLSEFFGEEAFVTIKKLNKYQFSLLLNKSRQGYTTHLYQKMSEYEDISDVEYRQLTESITPEETENRLKVEAEVDREYYIYSIQKDGHNFTDDKNNLIELDGGVFFDLYSGLVGKDGLSLNDHLIRAIISFNRKGIELGEQIG